MNNEGSSILEREVILATGGQASLIATATILLTLSTMLADPLERDHVLALRRASINRKPVEAASIQKLTKLGLLRDNQMIERTVDHVVAAALRGEGRELYLVSPFIDPKDRAISDLIIAATKVQAFLAPDQVAELLVPPQDDGLGPWTRRMKGTGPSGVSGPSAN